MLWLNLPLCILNIHVSSCTFYTILKISQQEKRKAPKTSPFLIPGDMQIVLFHSCYSMTHTPITWFYIYPWMLSSSIVKWSFWILRTSSWGHPSFTHSSAPYLLSSCGRMEGFIVKLANEFNMVGALDQQQQGSSARSDQRKTSNQNPACTSTR